ncbi:MAG: SH3 domain-containing protein, partial [Bryocella sp.]
MKNRLGFCAVGLAAASLVLLAGCSRFSHKKHSGKHVFVIAKQSYLVDRVAAVSNRVTTVTNGQELEVLGSSRKFVKVQTPDGKVGWIREDKVADEALADKFDELKDQHTANIGVAQATVHDEAYLHIAPGRETPRFFLMSEGDKVTLLDRASIKKALPPGAALAQAKPDAKKVAGVDVPTGPPPPPMEDWWLVRTAKGDVGWIYSHLIDVDIPDALGRYAEGQRYLGAYLLTKVEDPESGMVSNGNPVSSIPEYVAVLSPYKAGLPYDFNQVRVFTWNVKKHRYETAFRQKNIAGYLPLTLSMQKDPYGKGVEAQTPLPAFTFHVLAGGQALPQPDPTTG